MIKIITLLTGSILSAGYATQTPMALGPDHPANPEAPVAAAPPPSTTLAVIASPTRASPQSAEPSAPAHSGHDMRRMEHAGHAGTSQPAVESPIARPRAQMLYACPMHSEITSANPNDKCPKCKMKINKPVKAAPSPATAPADGGHVGHGNEHGGHQ